MEIIRSFFTFVFLPYAMFFGMLRDVFRGKTSGNSGHMAGLGDGFLFFAAVVSILIQTIILAVGIIIYLACS